MSFERVMYYFREISKIPRGTYNEKGISDYIVKTVKDFGLECYSDEIFNVIAIKEASEGYEDKDPIILQGHIDMVCQKTMESTHDFTKDPIILVEKGDYLYADGTTLGADNGIAVAYMLSILEDKTIKAPRVECVFTVSEEEGMDGANALDVTPLKGKRFLNIDSEEEGEFLAGCAGGSKVKLMLPTETKKCVLASEDKLMKLSVSGLLGGHSGTDINKNRANAVKCLGNILLSYMNENVDFRLVNVSGGGKDNAIPFYAEAYLITKEAEKLAAITTQKFEEVHKIYSESDPGLLYELAEADSADIVKDGSCNIMTDESCQTFVNLLTELPDGIQKKSDISQDLVETSLNWGILAYDGENIELSSAVRSMINAEVDKLDSRVTEIAEKYGADASVKGRYPAWEYVTHSPLRDKMVEIYKEITGQDAIVKVLHAGVECGMIASKIPGLDAVSFGPNLYDVHTVNEHMSLSSAERTYEFLLKILENL